MDRQPGQVRHGQLHVAIIGAGATGTELAAELHRTAREVVAFGMDRIDPADIRIIFVAAELVVWAAGVKAPEVLHDLDGLESNRINQLVVGPTLQTTRDPDIFAIGDCAECPRKGWDKPVPPRAQAAHQQASHLSDQLPRHMAGKELRPYVYRDFGSLITLGRYSTIGSLMGFLIGRDFRVEGWFARLMYRSLYMMHDYALNGGHRRMFSFLARSWLGRSKPGVKLH